MAKYEGFEEDIAYWQQRADDALESSDYAETDDEVEYWMSEYFSAKHMIDFVKADAEGKINIE
jgi:hypothetical protein